MKLCKVEACDKPYHSKGYCGRHYAQDKFYGGVKARTIHDRNDIRVQGDAAYISIYNLKNEVIAECAIDASDVDLVKPYKWHFSKGKNGTNYVRAQKIGLHNLILGAKIVDHINGDPSNNRRRNLRVASIAENNRNVSRHNGKTSSIYKGVFRDFMTKKPWKASVCGITVGRFADEGEAAWMYDQWALSLFGDFAKTNFEYHTIALLPPDPS